MDKSYGSYEGKRRRDKQKARFKEAMANKAKTSKESSFTKSKINTVDAAGVETFTKPGHEGWKIDIGPSTRSNAPKAKAPGATASPPVGTVPSGTRKVTYGLGKAGTSTVIDLGHEPSPAARARAQKELTGKYPTSHEPPKPKEIPLYHLPDYAKTPHKDPAKPSSTSFKVPDASTILKLAGTAAVAAVGAAAVNSALKIPSIVKESGADKTKITERTTAKAEIEASTAAKTRNRSPQVEAARNRLPLETEKFITAEGPKITRTPVVRNPSQNIKFAVEAAERADQRAKFQPPPAPKVEAPKVEAPTVAVPKIVIPVGATPKQIAEIEMAASRAAIGRQPTTPSQPTVKAPETPSTPKQEIEAAQRAKTTAAPTAPTAPTAPEPGEKPATNIVDKAIQQARKIRTKKSKTVAGEGSEPLAVSQNEAGIISDQHAKPKAPTPPPAPKVSTETTKAAETRISTAAAEVLRPQDIYAEARAAARSGDPNRMRAALEKLPPGTKKTEKWTKNLEAGIQAAGNKPTAMDAADKSPTNVPAEQLRNIDLIAKGQDPEVPLSKATEEAKLTALQAKGKLRTTGADTITTSTEAIAVADARERLATGVDRRVEDRRNPLEKLQDEIREGEERRQQLTNSLNDQRSGRRSTDKPNPEAKTPEVQDISSEIEKANQTRGSMSRFPRKPKTDNKPVPPGNPPVPQTPRVSDEERRVDDRRSEDAGTRRNQGERMTAKGAAKAYPERPSEEIGNKRTSRRERGNERRGAGTQPVPTVEEVAAMTPDERAARVEELNKRAEALERSMAESSIASATGPEDIAKALNEQTARQTKREEKIRKAKNREWQKEKNRQFQLRQSGIDPDTGLPKDPNIALSSTAADPAPLDAKVEEAAKDRGQKVIDEAARTASAGGIEAGKATPVLKKQRTAAEQEAMDKAKVVYDTPEPVDKNELEHKRLLERLHGDVEGEFDSVSSGNSPETERAARHAETQATLDEAIRRHDELQKEMEAERERQARKESKSAKQSTTTEASIDAEDQAEIDRDTRRLERFKKQMARDKVTAEAEAASNLKVLSPGGELVEVFIDPETGKVISKQSGTIMPQYAQEQIKIQLEVEESNRQRRAEESAKESATESAKESATAPGRGERTAESFQPGGATLAEQLASPENADVKRVMRVGMEGGGKFDEKPAEFSVEEVIGKELEDMKERARGADRRVNPPDRRSSLASDIEAEIERSRELRQGEEDRRVPGERRGDTTEARSKQADDLLRAAGSEDLAGREFNPSGADVRARTPEEIDRLTKLDVLAEARRNAELVQEHLESTAPPGEGALKNREEARKAAELRQRYLPVTRTGTADLPTQRAHPGIGEWTVPTTAADLIEQTERNASVARSRGRAQGAAVDERAPRDRRFGQGTFDEEQRVADRRKSRLSAAARGVEAGKRGELPILSSEDWGRLLNAPPGRPGSEFREGPVTDRRRPSQFENPPWPADPNMTPEERSKRAADLMQRYQNRVEVRGPNPPLDIKSAGGSEARVEAKPVPAGEGVRVRGRGRSIAGKGILGAIAGFAGIPALDAGAATLRAGGSLSDAASSFGSAYMEGLPETAKTLAKWAGADIALTQAMPAVAQHVTREAGDALARRTAQGTAGRSVANAILRASTPIRGVASGVARLGVRAGTGVMGGLFLPETVETMRVGSKYVEMNRERKFAEQEAAREKAEAESKYGTVEAATETRRRRREGPSLEEAGKTAEDLLAKSAEWNSPEATAEREKEAARARRKKNVTDTISKYWEKYRDLTDIFGSHDT